MSAGGYEVSVSTQLPFELDLRPDYAYATWPKPHFHYFLRETEERNEISQP